MNDTKPTYSKFHDFGNGVIAYTVKHPLLDEVKMYVETRRSGDGWIAYETHDEQTAVTGGNREQAVANILKQAEYVARGLRAQNHWYKLDELLVSGSTAWHALYSGRENADDTVAEGNVADNSTEYWELALSGYDSLMDELETRDRELAVTYNLENLTVCAWCYQHALETSPINSDAEFCPACLPVALAAHEWDSLDTYEQASKDAKNYAAEEAYEQIQDDTTLEWYTLALRLYRGLMGDAEPTGFYSKTGVAHTAECATVKAQRAGALKIPMPAECELPLSVVIAHVEDEDEPWTECGMCKRIRSAR